MSGQPPEVRRPRRLWVTRPAEDAADLAEALAARGIEPVMGPLLEIEYLDGPPLELAGVQALLATSANGVRAFARRNAERTLPLLAVGDATARTARALGFADVRSAAGDVAALADLTARTLDPAGGSLLHIAASEVAGDLGGALAAHGFACRRELLYLTRPAERLPSAVLAALAEAGLDGVVAFSPRTARTLVRLLDDAGLAAAAAELDCWCLSPAVAKVAAVLPWRTVIEAERPTQAGLLAAIGAAPPVRLPGVSNSLSSTAQIVGTLPPNEAYSRSWDGGMSIDTKSGQPTDDTAAPEQGDPTHTASVSAPTFGDGIPAGDDTTAAPWRPAEQATIADAAAAEEPARARDTASAPPPTKPSSSSGSSRGWLVGGALLLAVAAAGGAAWYYGLLQPQPAPAPVVENVDRDVEIDAALDDMDGRLAGLRQLTESLAPRLDALERSVAMLRQTVEQIEGQQSNNESLQAIDDRLGRLESQSAIASGLVQQVRSLEATTAVARDTASKLATTVLAVGQLAQAVDDGSPFVRQLAAVRALGGDDGDIAVAAVALEPLAGGGVPTLATLRGKFPPVADAIARAAPVTSGTGWTDRVAEQLASLVSVRRFGPNAIAAGGVDGILSQAQEALDGGDLAGAVAALQRLEQPEAQAAQEWLALANGRLAAERALATLQQRALARLSATRG